MEAAAATASSAPVEAATTSTPESISRHVCNQGAVETEAEKTLRERGGHLASHKMADDTGGAPPLSFSYIGLLNWPAYFLMGSSNSQLQVPYLMTLSYEALIFSIGSWVRGGRNGWLMFPVGQ